LCGKNESISYTALLELNHLFMVMPCIGKPQVHISWKMDSYVSGTIGNLCHNEFASHNLSQHTLHLILFGISIWIDTKIVLSHFYSVVREYRYILNCYVAVVADVFTLV
jgi:hypothetical protein